MIHASAWPRDVFVNCNTEIIDWLQSCFDKMVAGEELQPNPFYERNEKLTPVVVEAAIGAIEDKYKYELTHTPGYHLNVYNEEEYTAWYLANAPVSQEAIQNYGATKLRRPEFDALPYEQQLAIAQGMDEIFVRYRKIASEELDRLARLRAESVETSPVYTGDWYDA